jgi:hypothetical protein
MHLLTGRREGKGFRDAAVRACVADASPMGAGDMSCCHRPPQTGKESFAQSIRLRWRLARGAFEETLKGKRRPKGGALLRKVPGMIKRRASRDFLVVAEQGVTNPRQLNVAYRMPPGPTF